MSPGTIAVDLIAALVSKISRTDLLATTRRYEINCARVDFGLAIRAAREYLGEPLAEAYCFL